MCSGDSVSPSPETWNLTIKPLLRDQEVSMGSMPTKTIDQPTDEEMALMDSAIANGRATERVSLAGECPAAGSKKCCKI